MKTARLRVTRGDATPVVLRIIDVPAELADPQHHEHTTMRRRAGEIDNVDRTRTDQMVRRTAGGP